MSDVESRDKVTGEQADAKQLACNARAMTKMVVAYSNLVGRYGPDSEQVRQFREAHGGNRELMEYADALDRIKRHLGGSGMRVGPDAGTR